jgi:hypothetical protein
MLLVYEDRIIFLVVQKIVTEDERRILHAHEYKIYIETEAIMVF